MHLFYSTGIILYGAFIRLASYFNAKAKAWVHGRNDLFGSLKQVLDAKRGQKKLAWFHCASLGEFEQGRPLIEAYRQEHPESFILLSFFSPSGYENRRNYDQADYVTYLPLDTRKNVRRFLDLTRPDLAFFIKYEFWFNTLRELQKRKIPHYLVSAIFRSDQHFFKWYGDWPRSILKGFTHIFVQNADSKELLEFVGIRNVTISGDTRFDRVSQIASVHKEFPLIERFASGSAVLVAGSSWPADEELLVRFMNEHPGKVRIIIAPHEVNQDTIQALMNRCSQKCERYSLLTEESAGSCQVLIIDSIGMLSQIYRYGQIAYIGGGFGAGIHNILEAAVYGIPVLFGPNYGRFHEAVELISLKGAFPVHDYEQLELLLSNFLADRSRIDQHGRISEEFVKERTGATQRILSNLISNH